jgi:hypothetical protein
MVLNDGMRTDTSLATNPGCHSSANTLDNVYPLRFNSHVWEARCRSTMVTTFWVSLSNKTLRQISCSRLRFGDIYLHTNVDRYSYVVWPRGTYSTTEIVGI